MKIYNISPVAKPRMTQRDKWLFPRRTAVQKYFVFVNKIKEALVELPEDGAHVIFEIPMPKSWSKKKKGEMCGQLHKQTPDLDNLLKGISDAVYSNDAIISDIRITKRWAYKGSIQIFKQR